MKHDTPSATAILIAKSLVFVSGDVRYRSIMPSGMVEISRAFLLAVLAHWQISMLEIFGRFPPARWLVRLIESKSVPGMIGHYIVRKRRLEDLVAESSRHQGQLEQLVILGAGFDTLGTRTAQSKLGLRVYELDHPATSAAKQHAFARGYVTQPRNLSLLAVDLSKSDLRRILSSVNGFSFTAKTLFIAEGVFMYLTLDNVGRTIDILNEFSAGHASFAFTYMLLSETDRRPSFRGQTHGVDRWLGRKSEPFIWGASPESLNEFILKRGLYPIEHIDAKQLRDAYLINDAMREISTAVGENITWIKN
jgi:methyltransferase (TIGR00027 family)